MAELALDLPNVAHMAHLSRRSAVRALGEPAVMIPTTVFPLIFFGVLAGGVSAAGSIPGFPRVPYTDFVFTAPLVQVSLLAALSTSTLLANDIQRGFLDRLLLTPASSVSILVGHLMGAAAVVSVQVVIYLIVGLIIGVHIQTGVAGALVLVVLIALMTVGIGGIGTFVALRTGSPETVQGLFPVTFALLFLSSLTLPRDLIGADWFRVIATINPISYFIESIRSLIVTGWVVGTLARGFLVVAGALAVGLIMSVAALRGKVERT
jgi:ABC-2 type transport system permease protein